MKSCLLFTLGLLLTTLVQGQETRNIVVRTLCFRHVDGLKKIQCLTPGKKDELTEIPLWREDPSDDIKLKVAGSVIRFVIPAEGKDGKPTFKVVATGKLGSSKRQFFYFLPGKPGGEPYTVRCFNDGPSDFPMGSSRVVNLTGAPATVTLGETRTTIKPGATKIIPDPKKLNEYNDYNRVVEVASKDGRRYQILNNRGKASKEKREFIVIYINPRTKKPDVNIHRDIPPWLLPRDEEPT